MEIVGPILLLAVLIYGTMQWSRRRRGPNRPSEKHPRASSIGRAQERKSGKKQGRRGRNTPKADRSASDILATEPVPSKQSPAGGTAGLMSLAVERGNVLPPSQTYNWRVD